MKSHSRFTTLIVLQVILRSVSSCRNNFEGFGVHLGAIRHLNKSTDAVIAQVASALYNDLKLRLFRTSYESDFSISEDKYDISCKNSFSCTWNTVHRVMSGFPEARYFASIWSPPHYMKTDSHQLKYEYEHKYHQFIRNITELILRRFNQSIELVSLVNEPENFVAPWEHTNMGPHQLCRMVQEFDDPLVSACTENSWYSTTKMYLTHKFQDVDCMRACKIVLTHAYSLDFNPFSQNFLRAYYDSTEHEPTFQRPVWQTEVSSTLDGAEQNQMQEAFDLAMNIVRFVGTTCVSRYYFWSAFTIRPSGESLIWGNNITQLLYYPKKYFVYRHFTVAAFHSGGKGTGAAKCPQTAFPGTCLQFGNGNVTSSVFINQSNFPKQIKVPCSMPVCCTNQEQDYFCTASYTVPRRSVCSCLGSSNVPVG